MQDENQSKPKYKVGDYVTYNDILFIVEKLMYQNQRKVWTYLLRGQYPFENSVQIVDVSIGDEFFRKA